MFPTPTTQEIEHEEIEITNTGRRKTKDGKNSHSIGLADYARLLPTPTARAFQTPGEHGQGGQNLATVIGGQLNPPWVEWLMGYPIGWTDLKD